MKRGMKALLSVLLLAGVSFSGYAAVVTNWVADPGFEGLSAWDHPNADTTPWFSTGEGTKDNGFVARDLSIVNSGNQALKFTTWAGNAAAVQNLGVTLDSNKIYEISFSMRLDNKSTNASQTNETIIGISLGSSPTLGGTYSWTGEATYELAPSTAGVWEVITLIVDGADPDLIDNHGEYIQLIVKKYSNAKNSEYITYVDDISFGEYTPAAAPENLLIGYYGCASGTNDYAAAGIEGVVFLDKAYKRNTGYGSEDETYGNRAGASVLPGCYEVRIGSDPVGNFSQRVSFKITNKTGSPLELDAIAFDYWPWWNGAPQDVELAYGWGSLNGLTNGQSVCSTNELAFSQAQKGDYYDFEWSLHGLADRVLNNGETAAFQLNVSNATSVWSSGAFDNIAILGGAYAGAGYEAWAVQNNLAGGPLDDDDGDGVNNLLEYAQNGQAKNSDYSGTPPKLGAMDSAGGTNWIEYVYLKRVSADNGLTYSLLQNQDLIQGSWTNLGDIVEVGESEAVGDFKTVTNRVPTDGKAKEFIRLMIEAE